MTTMTTINLLQSHLRSANQGGKYLKYSYLCINRYRVVSHSEKFNFVQVWPLPKSNLKYFAP